jgi:hypothetical protein
MRRDDIEKLLGAYATGTLTAGERAALYEAALEDQALYDALMREEPLRELFEDPVAHARMIAVLSGSPARPPAWWRRPAPWAVAGTLATAGLVAFFLVAPRPSDMMPQMRMAQQPAPAPVLTEKKEIARAPSRKRPARESFKDAVSAVAPMPQAVDVKADFGETERAEAPAALGAAVATLSYKVLRQSGEQFVETAPGTVFDSGDVVRLAVVPPGDGQLIIDAGPEARIHMVAAKVGVPVIVPATGGIRLGPGAGVRTARITFLAAAEAKAMAKGMRMRDASSKESSNSVSGAAPVVVDVVLQFR